MAAPLQYRADGSVEHAAELLGQGELVVAPLDSVYVVLADAFAPDATAKLRAARGMSPAAPLTLLVRSHKQLPALASVVTEPAERLVAAFWPGPLTLLLPVTTTIAVDLGDTDGTVAVRWPLDERFNELTASVGPLACSTATRVGEPAPTEIDAAQQAFGDEVGCYLDDGQLDGSRSTVVDCSRGGAEVVRRGAVSADDVYDVATAVVGWGGTPSQSSDDSRGGAEAGSDDRASQQHP